LPTNVGVGSNPKEEEKSDENNPVSGRGWDIPVAGQGAFVYNRFDDRVVWKK
jgi:hypothetical protein